jgi:hypothetical protein
MAYNFPNSPNNGDTVVVNGSTYTYVSATNTWKTTASSGGGGGASVTSSDTAPTSPSDGDLWWNSAEAIMYVYYDDGSSSQWVSTSTPGPRGESGLNVTTSNTAPSSPTAGQFWWNTDVNRLYIYYTDADSSQWVQATTPGADGADGSSVTSYANYAAFPTSGNSVGDFAFATDTKAVYIWDGSEWDRMYTDANETPEWTTNPNSTYELQSGTNTVITVAASDPEGFPITYSHDTNPSNQTQATITNNGGTFTLVPSSNTSHAGNFTLRFKATDGVHVASQSSTIVLAFYDFTISPAINSASEWTLSSDGDLVLDSAGTYTIVPSSDLTIDTKMWGAGGSTTGNLSGGAGGYSSGTLSLTAGTSYIIRVGSETGGGSGQTGSGGGYSGIFEVTEAHANSVIIAGGGGGGCSQYSAGQTSGAGGGASGQTGTGGGGGTQTAGGAGALAGNGVAGTAGSALTGGAGAATGSYGGGGGGSGYYGGGGGAARSGGDGGNNGMGGGGSGYIGHSIVTNGVTTTGSATTPANSTDTDRGTAGNPANPGKVIISVAA